MTDYIIPEVTLAEADAITRDIFGDYAATEDLIDHAAVSEDYRLTPETLAELRLLLDDAPQLPYRVSPRTHGNPSDGPTYVALEAQLEGRWEEVATGNYDRWSDMGLGLAAAAINALPALLDTTDELAHMTEARDNARAELAHMTEARDNARAEVERLTGQIEAAKRIGLTHLGRAWADVLNDVLRALSATPTEDRK